MDGRQNGGMTDFDGEQQQQAHVATLRRSSSGSTSTPMASLSLIDLIDVQEWRLCMLKMQTEPMQARIVTKIVIEGQWTQAYPLHLAVTKKPPSHLIDALVRVFPEALLAMDEAAGRLPLHIACIYTASAQVLKRLLAGFPEATRFPDKINGRLPVHYACLFGSPFEIAVLVEAEGRALIFRDKAGNTALDLAQKSNNPHKDAILRRLEEKTIRISESMGIKKRAEQVSDEPISETSTETSVTVKRNNSKQKPKIEVSQDPPGDDNHLPPKQSLIVYSPKRAPTLLTETPPSNADEGDMHSPIQERGFWNDLPQDMPPAIVEGKKKPLILNPKHGILKDPPFQDETRPRMDGNNESDSDDEPHKNNSDDNPGGESAYYPPHQNKDLPPAPHSDEEYRSLNGTHAPRILQNSPLQEKSLSPKVKSRKKSSKRNPKRGGLGEELKDDISDRNTSETGRHSPTRGMSNFQPDTSARASNHQSVRDGSTIDDVDRRTLAAQMQMKSSKRTPKTIQSEEGSEMNPNSLSIDKSTERNRNSLEHGSFEISRPNTFANFDNGDKGNSYQPSARSGGMNDENGKQFHQNGVDNEEMTFSSGPTSPDELDKKPPARPKPWLNNDPGGGNDDTVDVEQSSASALNEPSATKPSSVNGGKTSKHKSERRARSTAPDSDVMNGSSKGRRKSHKKHSSARGSKSVTSTRASSKKDKKQSADRQRAFTPDEVYVNERTPRKSNSRQLEMFLRKTAPRDAESSEQESDSMSKGAFSLPANIHSLGPNGAMLRTNGPHTNTNEGALGISSKDEYLIQFETQIRNLDVRKDVLAQECKLVNKSVLQRLEDVEKAHNKIIAIHRKLAEYQDKLAREQANLERIVASVALQRETLVEHESKLEIVESERKLLLAKKAHVFGEGSLSGEPN